MVGSEDPLTFNIQEVDIWVQVFDIPRDFLSKSVVRNVGLSLGKYLKSIQQRLMGCENYKCVLECQWIWRYH